MTTSDDWWNDLLPDRPHTKPPALLPMLRVIAYDIADPKRLQRVASLCEDFATRVQDSVFECWLDDIEFERFWKQIQARIDEKEDRVVVYRMDSRSAAARLTAGKGMVCTERRQCYFV